MEIIVGNASYPTPQIGANSHPFRPLGIGYANLGALLMARGLPYDSDAGRDYAAAITALMSGAAYAQSGRIAEAMGPFDGFETNREPMLRVMRKHRDAVKKIDAGARAARAAAAPPSRRGTRWSSSATAPACATARSRCSPPPARSPS